MALGAGYSIRSVHSGHYITVDSGIGDGVSLIASLFPVSWEVEADTFEEGTWRYVHLALQWYPSFVMNVARLIYSILWPNTQFNFDLSSPDAGNGQVCFFYSLCVVPFDVDESDTTPTRALKSTDSIVEIDKGRIQRHCCEREALHTCNRFHRFNDLA